MNLSLIAVSLSMLVAGALAPAGWAKAGLMDSAQAMTLVDPNATPETVALAQKMGTMRGRGFMFGQQNATTEGIGWQDTRDEFCGDICKVSGMHPAVYGWDFSDYFGKGDVAYAVLRAKMRQVYAAGGINTLSWHFKNPVTGGPYNDLTPACSRVIAGADHHEQFLGWVDELARFLATLTDQNGKPIPVIFRPFHESNAKFFWWGASVCGTDDLNTLWVEVVTRLRDQDHIHQLLYTYSPYWFPTAELSRWPGDQWVDIVGLDFYFFAVGALLQRDLFAYELLNIAKIANDKGKIAALTEVGYETVPFSNWWTSVLLDNLKSPVILGNLSYAMIWRNENAEHFYGPYPGQASCGDFNSMARDPASLFLEDIQH